MPTAKTKTSPSGLTPEERKELSRRGFLVKEVLSYDELSVVFINSIGITALVVTFGSISNNPIFAIAIATIMPFLVYGNIMYYYIVLGKLFYTPKNILGYGGVYDDVKKVPYFRTVQSFRDAFLNGDSLIVQIVASLGALILGLCFLYLDINDGSYSSSSVRSNFFMYYYIGLFYILLPVLVFTLRQVVERFHSLYAFGNLGAKISSLTPNITLLSNKIQKSFSKNINFRTLSDSFDTLAKDFSKVSSYVIKLETIEQKANKGNLFDSEKYIGSLREDIVKPLTTLRSFLEKKKTELEEGQQEMKKVRVRVGGSGNGGAENLELQSKRSEPLISELTENIEKLDIMIEKFGKI